MILEKLFMHDPKGHGDRQARKRMTAQVQNSSETKKPTMRWLEHVLGFYPTS